MNDRSGDAAYGPAAEPASGLFVPRPEACAVEWKGMLRPVSKAVGELLWRMAGAVRTLATPGGSVATCFLVAGERGTGKTTVLLSAAKAARDPESYFPSPRPGEDEPHETRAARAHAVEIHARAHWLQALDVEPLPANANLLTALLVRVRTELAATGTHSRASLFEDRAGSARGGLDRLIDDSALVWEDIEESTTRDRANRQVAAAETYARFHDDLVETIAAVCKDIALRAGRSEDEAHALVLPIDNIDRSPEHLYRIFKLAQIVACKQLWLVLAGDRFDINAFLERAYWKELLQTGAGQIVGKKISTGGEDEALSLARRQAAATIRKTLPPSHRVRVRAVSPDEVLAFEPDGERSLRKILHGIPLWRAPGPDGRRNDPTAFTPATLLELLLVNPGVAPGLSEERPGEAHGRDRLRAAARELWRRYAKTQHRDEQLWSLLTQHARPALQLPARSLVDLGQLCLRATSRSHPERQAMQIVRSMLRLAIAESGVSGWAADALQNQLLQRDAEENSRLAMESLGTPWCLRARRIRSLERIVRGSLPDDDKTLERPKRGDPTVEILGSEMRLTWGTELEIALESSEESEGAHGGPRRSELLPNAVIGWLLLLHDLLIFAPKPLVLNAGDFLADYSDRVRTAFRFAGGEGVATVQLAWPLPAWDAAFDMSLLGTAWSAILIRLNERALVGLAAGGEMSHAAWRRFAALLWIDTVCTIGAAKLTAWPGSPRLCELLFTFSKEGDSAARPALEEALPGVEEEVLKNAENALADLTRRAQGVHDLHQEDGVRDKALHDWLLFELPRFFLPELDTGLPEEATPGLCRLWEPRAREIAARRLGALLRATAGEGRSHKRRLSKKDGAAFIRTINDRGKGPLAAMLAVRDWLPEPPAGEASLRSKARST